jgi:hypothetical protein
MRSASPGACTGAAATSAGSVSSPPSASASPACQNTPELAGDFAGASASSSSALAASSASNASSAERVVAAGWTSDFVMTEMSLSASESAGSVIATIRPLPANPTGTAW